MSQTVYDMIIVGGGIAGLRTANEAIKINKKLKCLIIEKYPNLGGRIDTIETKVDGKQFIYEAGAGRVHSTHKLTLKLIKAAGLTTTPMKAESMWRELGSSESETNNFNEIWAEFCNLFRKIDRAELSQKTLREVAITSLGVDYATKLLEKYPYRAEIEVMNAAAALDLFETYEKGEFLHVNEGLSKIVAHLRKSVEKEGVDFKINTEIQRISLDNETNIYKLSGLRHEKLVKFYAHRIVLAVHVSALTKIYPFSTDHPLVKHVRMEPLLRIYSVYEDSEWMPDSNVITNSPLRFIIPINKSKGLIMSSYLDSRDIEVWKGCIGKDEIEQLKIKIQFETQHLFPEKTIPKATSTKTYLWTDGCSYWLPGAYDYRKMSASALNPMLETYPNLHLVGESFSTKQQWIEGSLEHADHLIEHIKEDLKRIGEEKKK
jgi:monoamine oxidase